MYSLWGPPLHLPMNLLLTRHVHEACPKALATQSAGAAVSERTTARANQGPRVVKVLPGHQLQVQ